MTKTLLETGEQRLLVVGLNMNHSVGRKAWQGDRLREKIGPRDRLKHLALVRTAILAVISAAAARHLMHIPEPQPSSRKPSVDVFLPEGKN